MHSQKENQKLLAVKLDISLHEIRGGYMGKEGWISIHRRIQDCWIWHDDVFSRGQAWIDLLLMANHRDVKIAFGNQLINVETGSFITSKRKLSERWRWSNTKVDNFLKLLESDK